MHLKRVNVLIFILTAGCALLSAGIPENMQYVFPGDGARLIARNSNIILRPGSVLQSAADLNPELLSVRGSKSGRISGRIVLAGDYRSLLFYPDALFEPGEEITVEVKQMLRGPGDIEFQPFVFAFTVTPLSEPVNPNEMFESTQKQLPGSARPGKVSDELPEIVVTVTGETAPGYLFLAPTQFTTYNGYLVMINDQGDLLYQQPQTDAVPLDFKVQPNGMLSYGLMNEYFTFAGGGYTDFFTMDSTYSVTDIYQMGNGYIADFHDFQILPNGHSLLFGYDLQPVDMSQLTELGRPDAMVAGSIVQELDVDHNVIFQWRSWDYYHILDTYNDVTLKRFDAIHINSVDVSKDGHLIVSALALGEVTKINRQTGEIIWRLNGKNNQFTFINEDETYAPLYFMFQHDVRCLDNGHLTIFDNGASQMNRRYSRGVEYAIDESAMTATKVWEYRPNPDIYVPTMGNMQRLPNGNTLICWGFSSMNGGLAATEVDAGGNKVMELKFAEDGWTTYRVFRFPYDGGKPAVEVTIYEVQEGNIYDFKEGEKEIGITMTITNKPGSGYNEVRGYFYNYGPFQPQFPELAPNVLPMRFVMDRYSIDQMRADLEFDIDYFGFGHPETITVYHREYEGSGMFFPLTTTYNPVTRKVIANMRRFGEFIFVNEIQQHEMARPFLVSPVSQSLIDQNNPVTFTWSAQGVAFYYDFQVAADSSFDSLLLDESDLTESAYLWDMAQPDTRHYWRVRASTDLDTSEWAMAWFDAVPPYLEIIFPELGTQWQVGIKHFIDWDDNLTEDVAVILYNDDHPVSVLDTVETVSAYHWDVPYNMPPGNMYRIRIGSVDNPSLFTFSERFILTDSVEPPPPEIDTFFLYQNSPNPVTARTLIQYDLPVECDVRLEVFNILGQCVAVPVNGWIGTGRRTVSWAPSAGGIYYYRIKAAPLDSGTGFKTYQAIRKMIVVR